MDTGVLFGALLIGGLLGLAPLILGVLKHKLGLGIGGFIACVAGGFILGILLAAPVCALFIWLIVRQSDSDVEKAVDVDGASTG